MAGRQPGSGRQGDGRLLLSPEAPHGTPRRPRSQDPGPAAQILRRADRRDPVTPEPARLLSVRREAKPSADRDAGEHVSDTQPSFAGPARRPRLLAAARWHGPPARA